MGKKDYQQMGLNGSRLQVDEINYIGKVAIVLNDNYLDNCVIKRMKVHEKATEALYQISNEEGLQHEQKHSIVTYLQYHKIVSNVHSIRQKLADAEQTVPNRGYGRRGANAAEDKIMASIIERKTGHNPYSEWIASDREIDAINKARRKLYSEHDAPSLQIVREYDPTKDTPDREGYRRYLMRKDSQFFIAIADLIKAVPDSKEMKRHTYITGGSGSGKSELLKVLIRHTMTKETEATIVIDPHGDMVEQISRWRDFKDNDRLLYIDPFLSHDHIPPFNPLAIAKDTSPHVREVIAQQLLSAFEQILKGTGGDSLTVNMRAALMPCILTLIDRPNSTLADLQRFMNDARNEDLVAFGRQSPRRTIKDFFSHEFVQDGTLQLSKSAISRKLQSLFNAYAFDEIINSKTSIDLNQAINEKKIILFNLAKGRLGNDASEAFGRLVVASIQGIALRRADTPEAQRVPLNLYIDECQNYISPATIEILEEARKYGVNMTLAQQLVGRGMSTEMQSVVMNNTNIKVAGRTLEDSKMAKVFGIEQNEMQQLETGSFWMKVGNGQPFKIMGRSDYVGNENHMSETEWQAVKSRLLNWYRPIQENSLIQPDNPETPKPFSDRDLV